MSDMNVDNTDVRDLIRDQSKTLIITRGLPASGKTTWAEEFVETMPMGINVNSDDYRRMYKGEDYKFNRGVEKLIFGAILNDIKLFLDSDLDYMIISDTNFNESKVEMYKKTLFEYHVDHIPGSLRSVWIADQFMSVPLKVCLERDAKRDKPVGHKVIKQMYNKNKCVRDSIDSQKVINDDSKPNAIVVDIDGTIAQNVTGRPWYDANAAILKDAYVEDVIEVINELRVSFDAKILFVTGRNIIDREWTHKWLDAHPILSDMCDDNFENVHMNSFDGLRDVEYKKLMVKLTLSDYNVKAIFEDRQKVVDMYRDCGYRVYQVDWSN